MKEIIKFCHEEGLVLFADEVWKSINNFVLPGNFGIKSLCLKCGTHFSSNIHASTSSFVLLTSATVLLHQHESGTGSSL